MKISLFILSFLAAFATAGGTAGGYERMFLWYAYEISLAANGASNTIAKGCIGKRLPMDPEGAPPNQCSFNEFIRYIDETKNFRKYVETGNKLPDVPTIGAKLGNRDAGKGLPELNTMRIAGATGYGSLMNRVSNIILNAKKDAAKEGSKLKITDQLKRADQALGLAIEYREMDTEDYRRKAYKAVGEEKKVTIKLSMVEVYDTRYYKYNAADTVKANPDHPKLQEELEEFDRQYMMTEKPAKHRHTLDVVRSARAHINKPIVCSPTKKS
ncbi:hypothetical protein V494_07070 [Pseudogymnoascus sp. VKM F-4513 (FW-928)]|nr:hypothetical protein V494_07070 [Pseudogymnoascus sp. VKM F-4513 (FW-928)]